MNKKLDIGIVNYNGGDALSKCISSLRSLKGVDVGIYIADNASGDHSLADAQKAHPACTWLPLEKNLGYAGACNFLLPYLKSDIVVLCNMDLEFDPAWGSNLLECFENCPDASSVSTAVYEKETGRLYSGGVRFYHDLYPLSTEFLQSPDHPYEVFGSYGAVMTFKREVFEKVGMFDEDYFLFFEETEFYLRMNAYGLKTYFCPAAKVFHHRSVATVRYSPLKLYYSERNRIMTAFKYLPLWYFPVVFAVSAFRIFVMAKKGVPAKDGHGKKVHKGMVVACIAKAWAAALLHTGREWKKRLHVWHAAGSSPMLTLAIIKKYKLSRGDLKIR